MITYDDQGRAFWNGKRIPRTTEICSILAPRWQCAEYYLHKGQIIHTITEWEDTKELDESSVDPTLEGYLKAYREFKMIMAFIPVKIELQVYHPRYKYCGRIDRYGMFYQRRHSWVIDIKSGTPHESDLLQAPAYMFAMKESGFPVEKCGDLYLKANGTFRFREVKNPTDKFLTFLTGIPRWREQNEIRGRT